MYDLKSSLNNFDPTLQNFLFGAVKLTKNQYSTYGIGFDSRGTFSHPSGGNGVNVVIFGVNVSSSAYYANRAKSILLLGESRTQGPEETNHYIEKLYSVKFMQQEKNLFEFAL